MTIHKLISDGKDAIKQEKPNRILRKSEVRSRLGIGNTTIWSLTKKGLLPKPIKINERAVGWLESDIEAFIASRVASRQVQDKGVCA